MAGDLGDWTRTLGGDGVGDLGGAKAIMDVGLGLELPLQGSRTVLARGVPAPAPLEFTTLGEVLPTKSLGMSSDMRPSALRPSSGMASRSLAHGERWRGVAGGADLVALSMFSNWARREETGFCGGCQH